MSSYASRRRFLTDTALLGLGLLLPARWARAFGEDGAFNPRPLLTGQSKWEGTRATAPARWSRELVNRTSAPARLNPTPVRADDDALWSEPFAYLSGDSQLAPFTDSEITHLRRFFAEGGVLFVDDNAPETGVFTRDVKRELARVLPDAAPIALGTEHVVFRTFYFIRRPFGRLEGPPRLEGIVRGGSAQVIFSSHDLGGALAQSSGGMWSVPVSPGGEIQRERALRLAVNIAMYVLCSNYKDDQVHAPFLMRRRAVDVP
ncbi:MAG: DUF4159 domain-containing protein [Polyangiaceae bacterium]